MLRSNVLLYVFLFTYVGSNIVRASESDIPLDFKPSPEPPLTKVELNILRDEAKEMFYHGYNAYMDNAFPADELMPLSCKGRWRDTEVSRGDIDEALGNFSLTLVDSLDTLVVLGDIQEFERALKLIIKEVSFDNNVVVSVFETNIRMVGGLISGHVLAEHVNQLYGVLSWYRGELLTMAQDLATRLLPAFNTTTGIPHPRVNLKYGLKSAKVQNSRDTCTACAGTIILEFASLSRLTGQPIFEEKARQVMDYLWAQRHRGTDLVGTVLNVHSGDWVRRDSGVGAGIDSYYEYLLKAYILLGDDAYLDRFNTHYSAVMKYISQGPMLVDVHMHRPETTSRNFMDALLAFWPGLQVLKGDIKPAIETHEMLYQIIQRHNFLPEAFTTDFQIHWGQHPLRPEFVESTYLLYQATGDPYYLRVGQKVLKSLQKHAFVPCGYAAVKDVRTGAHEDRMDSFVLAETFKYLYLLFADPKDLVINLDEFIFTTEAHLLPLTLARLSNLTTVPLREKQTSTEEPDVEYARSCPNAYYLFPGRHQFAQAIRQPLKNFVKNICPTQKILRRKLRAPDFNSQNADHLNLLRDMGINMMLMSDGRVQMLHTASNAKTSEDAEEGLLFLQEMLDLSKAQQEQPENPPRSVSFQTTDDTELTFLVAGPAQFGLELSGQVKISGPPLLADPIKACGSLSNADQIKGKIVIVERGDCMFIEKARLLESLGALGGIVVDNNSGSSADTAPMFAMSGDGNNDVTIPLVFLFSADAQPLLDPESMPLQVTLADYPKPSVTKVHSTNAEFIIQHTGTTVKSSIKKHQDVSETTCTDDIVCTDTTPAPDKDQDLWEALREITQPQKKSDESEKATTSTDKSSRKSKMELIQQMLLARAKDDPKFLKELLGVHLVKLIHELKEGLVADWQIEKSMLALSKEAFQEPSRLNLDDVLLEQNLKEQLHAKLFQNLPSLAGMGSGAKGAFSDGSGSRLTVSKPPVEGSMDSPSESSVPKSASKGDPDQNQHDEL